MGAAGWALTRRLRRPSLAAGAADLARSGSASREGLSTASLLQCGGCGRVQAVRVRGPLGYPAGETESRRHPSLSLTRVAKAVTVVAAPRQPSRPMGVTVIRSWRKASTLVSGGVS